MTLSSFNPLFSPPIRRSHASTIKREEVAGERRKQNPGMTIKASYAIDNNNQPTCTSSGIFFMESGLVPLNVLEQSSHEYT